MKFAVSALAAASFADALTSRQAPCCFDITASGGPGGPVGQLSDGQNRIGQGLPPAQYCINNGALTDGSGRGCILTPPTTQFQCDVGASPHEGFAVGCDGSVTYNGSPQFWACATEDHGGYNIYTQSQQGLIGCVPVTLSGDSCRATCAPPPPPSPPSPPPPPAPSSNSCPANLAGSYEYPHLIVQVNSSQPSAVGGTSYNGNVSPSVSSIFNFDIPLSAAGKTCSLIFLLPPKSSMETSSYTMSGSGQVDFSLLNGLATQGTSANNLPSVKQDYSVLTLSPGNSYSIASFPCPANQAVAYQMKSVDGTSFEFFQDYNPAPIGLYITVC